MALWARSPLTLLVFARGSSSVVRACLVVDVETSCGQVIMGRFAARPHVARMLAAGLPRAFIAILFALAYMPVVAPNIGDIDAAEIFAGKMEIVKAAAREGYLSRGLGLDYSDAFDLTSSAGFLLAVICVRRVRCGGLCTFAPVCSSFAFINQWTSGRNVLLPEGLPTPGVVVGNLLAFRTLLLWRFADALGIFTLLEQPVHNSTGGMQALPKFQELLRELTVYRVKVLMAWFGAETTKPTWLYVNHRAFAALLRYKQPKPRPIKKAEKQLVKTSVVNGKKRLTGIKNALQSTQEYTPLFAEAVIKSWREGCQAAQTDRFPQCRGCAVHREENIRLLFAAPLQFGSDEARLNDVLRYLGTCSLLKLSRSWPADWF